MVGWRVNDTAPDRSIVDGQQRLTTIALLLVSIRDAFTALGETELAKGVQRFVERPDRDNRLRFVIQPESPSVFVNNVYFSTAGDRTAIRLYAMRRGWRPRIRAVDRVFHVTPEWSNSRSR